jgi:hypothetical protein
VPCVYKGVTDTEKNQRRYYKLAVPRGKTLKVVMRTREGDAPRTEIRLHGPDGASLSGYYAYGGSVLTKPIEFKADEPAVVYVGVNGGVRSSAFDFSLR